MLRLICLLLGLLTTCTTFGQDFDGDGIANVLDLDNDNDGILDADECAFTSTVTQSFTSSGGTSVTNSSSTGRGTLYIDFTKIDNSFNLTINGGNIAGELQFQPGASGNFARFDDGFTYGQNGVPQLWAMTGTTANPILRAVVDADGNLKLYGARSSGGPLVDLTLDTPPSTIAWNALGTNTIILGQLLTGPTNMRGSLRFSGECDSDGDGIFNRFDLDSDNDGIYDAVEAGHGQAHSNGELTGAVGTDGVPNTVQVDPNGEVVNYILRNTDGDTNTDARDFDSDSDGCADVLEAGFTQSGTITGELQGSGYNTTNGLVTGNTDGYTIPNDVNSNGTYDFQEALVPVISDQPLSVTICTSCSGTVSVTATDANSYQWQLFDGIGWSNLNDSSRYSGTNTNSLTITGPLVTNHGDQYRVLVSSTANTCTLLTSTTAVLSVVVAGVLTNRRITYRVNKNL